MKALIGAGIALAIIAAAIAASLLLIGPRMKEQPHLLPYQDSTCLAPEGSVPVEGSGAWPEADSPIATRSVPLTAAAGRVYYGYYCEFCHGEKGDGNGPVGESYVPRPADLRTEAIRRFSDSALVKAMLNGPGHTVERNGTLHPVLARIIPPADLPAIVQYVRTFGIDSSGK